MDTGDLRQGRIGDKGRTRQGKEPRPRVDSV